MRVSNFLIKSINFVGELPSKLFKPITSALNVIFGKNNTCQGVPYDVDGEWNRRWDENHSRLKILTPEELSAQFRADDEMAKNMQRDARIKNGFPVVVDWTEAAIEFIPPKTTLWHVIRRRLGIW